MHLQPNRNYASNDDVQTPPALARRIVEHFRPRGRVLEPCAGDGNFLRVLRAFARTDTHLAPQASRVAWCEIKRGRDFLAWRDQVDWVVTNPPWSEIRTFLRHAMTLADEIVMLFTVNHLWTRARIRDITTAGFGVREIVLLDMPRTFPPSGFQLGAVHISRGWLGPIALTDWTKANNSIDDARNSVEASTKRWTATSGRRLAASARRTRPEAAFHLNTTASFPAHAAPRALPSQWMSAAELAALTPQEHLRLILRAA